MDNSLTPPLGFWLSKIPSLMKTYLWHVLKRSKQSKYWDLRTALTIRILDIFINESPPINVLESQNRSIRDHVVKGKIWVSRAKIPAPPEDSVRQILFRTIEKLKEPGELAGGYEEPRILPVEGEWTGYRANATAKSPEPSTSEAEKYKEMMREVKSKTTILYFHGGAHYLLDPAFYRSITRKLAKKTQGRCFSLRYRLSPRNPFPAALLDAFTAYLALLYPPPESYHEPVSPSHIVFAGDSAGGNLCFALLQLILEIQRQSFKVTWHGEEREVPTPAGVATSSPWLDIISCLPSIINNRMYDYLPKHDLKFKASEIWPTNPPRKFMYMNDSMATHPLVSPILAKNWKGSCPFYIATGWELLADEDKFGAMQIANQGAKVIFEDYEAMPHCFGLILSKLPESSKFFESWSRNISLMVERPNDLETSGTLIRAKTLKLEKIDVLGLSSLTYEKVVEYMKEKLNQKSEIEVKSNSEM